MKKLIYGLIFLLAIGMVSALTIDISLGPSTAYTTDDLVANVTCTGVGNLTAYWTTYLNSTAVGSDNDTVTNGTKYNVVVLASETQKSDTWSFDAFCGNGTLNTTASTSNSVTILNTAPVAASASLSPTTATPTTTFTCSGSASDADSDTMTSSYQFVVGTTVVQAWGSANTYTCDSTNCPVTSSVKCQFKANDGEADSNTVDSNIVSIISPVASLDISDLALGGSAQEKSNPDEDEIVIISGSVTVTNTGTKTLSNIQITNNNIASKYNISFSQTTISSLAAGASETVVVSANVPEDLSSFYDGRSNPQDDRALTIGGIKVTALDGTDTITDTNTVTMETENQLEIYRLYVSVDGDEEKYDDEDKVKDIQPGAKIEVRLIADARYSSSSNVDMENIEFNVIIDEGDLDIDESEDIKDIDAGDDREEATLDFEIDSDADEDDYTMIVTLTGDDSYDATHGEQWEVTLEVKKEREKIDIKKAELSPETLSCQRTATLETRIENVGRDNSDEITLEIKNDALGIFSITRNIDLDETDDYTKTLTIDVGSSVAAGTYPIRIYTYFDDDAYDDEDISDYGSVDLVISACNSGGNTGEETGGNTGEETGGNTGEETGGEIIVTGGDTGTAPNVITPSQGGAVAREPVEVGTSMSRSSFIALMILAYVIVIGIGLYLIFGLLKK